MLGAIRSRRLPVLLCCVVAGAFGSHRLLCCCCCRRWSRRRRFCSLADPVYFLPLFFSRLRVCLVGRRSSVAVGRRRRRTLSRLVLLLSCSLSRIIIIIIASFGDGAMRCCLVPSRSVRPFVRPLGSLGSLLQPAE